MNSSIDEKPRSARFKSYLVENGKFLLNIFLLVEFIIFIGYSIYFIISDIVYIQKKEIENEDSTIKDERYEHSFFLGIMFLYLIFAAIFIYLSVTNSVYTFFINLEYETQCISPICFWFRIYNLSSGLVLRIYQRNNQQT